MTIAYFSNYFNHHQKPFADAMNAQDGIDYTFVCTTEIPEFRRQLGYQELTAEYVLDASLSEGNRQKAMDLAITADVAIFGGGKALDYIAERLKHNKLTFNTSERRLKRGIINALSPNFLKHLWIYFRYGKNTLYYMLSCSAYATNDYNMFGAFIDRCYKWAYFTKVTDIYIDNQLASKRQEVCRIMWCSRFIDWKHPELCIDLANRLKQDGVAFEINMYGNGPLMEKYQTLVQRDGLSGYVNIMGNRSNDEILTAMQQHNIFLFTSDQNEGWGAVANEAMSNGCTLVGADKIGAVPFLVNDGVNGKIFKSKDAISLYDAVKDLVTNRDTCEQLAKEAYHSMKDVWSPENAVKQLLTLIDSINRNKENPIHEGPCSKAEPIK